MLVLVTRSAGIQMDVIITVLLMVICIGEDMVTGTIWTEGIRAGVIIIARSTMTGRDITVAAGKR
jgi:hypothetical protein